MTAKAHDVSSYVVLRQGIYFFILVYALTVGSPDEHGHHKQGGKVNYHNSKISSWWLYFTCTEMNVGGTHIPLVWPESSRLTAPPFHAKEDKRECFSDPCTPATCAFTLIYPVMTAGTCKVLQGRGEEVQIWYKQVNVLWPYQISELHNFTCESLTCLVVGGVDG